jgi:hypothetical protein
MKKNNTLKSFLSFSIIIPLVFISFSSCHRNKDCDLVLNIEDGTSGGPVVGALVEIGPNQTSTTNGTLQIQVQSSTTNASGIATFTFKLPAILSATVTPPSPLTAPLPTLVKLEEGRSVTKAIKCY